MTATRAAKASLWGLALRGVLWYSVAGVVLGGMYGYAYLLFVVLWVFLLQQEPLSAAVIVATVPIATVLVLDAGAAGWALARAFGAHPLGGAAMGVFAGVSLPGVAIVPFSIVALFVGGVAGGAYGLIVGLANGVATAVVARRPLDTAARAVGVHRKLMVKSHRAVVVVLAVLSLTCALVFQGSAREAAPVLTFGVVFLFVPGLVVCIVAGWIGSYLADRCAVEQEVLVEETGR